MSIYNKNYGLTIDKNLNALIVLVTLYYIVDDMNFFKSINKISSNSKDNKLFKLENDNVILLYLFRDV